MIIVADSWIWVEYFRGTKYGALLNRFLSSGEVVTPNIVLLEIASKYVREGRSQEEIELRLRFIVSKSTIAEFDYELAVDAAKCLLELRSHAKKLGIKKKPGIADGLILAIARKLNAKILSGDEHFRGLPETIYAKDYYAKKTF